MSGHWDSGKDMIAGFLREMLLAKVVAPDCQPKLNIQTEFRDYIVTSGAPKFSAEQHAILWYPQLTMVLEERLKDWDELGIPRPMELSDQFTCLTWRHPKYTKVTGRDPLAQNYIDVYDWVRTRKERDFLFVCACVLILAGADPVCITDGRGDEGADLIARLAKGLMRSAMLVVQSKTSSDPISRDMVLLEYGKYAGLLMSPKMIEYRRALGLEHSSDGSANCYMFLSNTEFSPSARDVASRLGVLIRCSRQIAFWLAAQTTRMQLETAFTQCQQDLDQNPETNLATKLRPLLGLNLS